MIQNILDFKNNFFRIFKGEYVVVLLSILILILSPSSWKDSLEITSGKTISLDAYMLILNTSVNIIGALVISFISLFIKRLETVIVTKGKNKKIKVIDDRITTIYLDISFKKPPFFSKFIFKNIYLKIEASNWIELTLGEAIQNERNELLIPLSEYLEEVARLDIQIIRSCGVNNNREGKIISKIISFNSEINEADLFKIRVLEMGKNILRKILLILSLQYKSLEEEVEVIIGE